jgi:hypothetical protein
MDVAPIIKNSRTLTPFRTVFEELGFSVEWDEASSKITGTKNKMRIELWINKDYAIVNGTQIILDVAPIILSSRTLVPLRFVSENAGAYVEWNGDTKKVHILKINFLKTNILTGKYTYSPSADKAFFSNSNQYYICDADGSNIIKIGPWKKIKWLDNKHLYVEDSSKKYVIDLAGNKQEVSEELFYTGKTFDEKYFYLKNSILYCNIDPNEISKISNNDIVKDLNFKIKAIAALSANGPYVVVPEDKDELQLFSKFSDTPVIIGKGSALVNALGYTGVDLFDTEVFFESTGKYLAFYQSDGDTVSINVVDLKKPTDIKNSALAYKLSTATKKNLIKTAWVSNDTLRIENEKLDWSIRMDHVRN